MTRTDPEWQQWTSAWSQTSTMAHINESALIAKARQQHRQVRLAAIGELLLSALVIAQALHFLQLKGPQWQGFVMVSIVIIVGFQMAALWLRSGLWRARLLDGVAALRYQQRRAHFRLRYVWLNLAGLPLLWVAMTPLFADLWRHSPRGFGLMLFGQVIVTTAALIWGWLARRRALVQLDVARQLLREFDQEA